MAYFSALGGTGGTSATITVTYSEDFYGVTITATNGTTTLTKTATSSGTLTFDVSEGGTWVVSGTVEGATYYEQVDVFFEYTVPPLVALPDGSTALPVNDIQMWLKCAAIRDKTSYTTLSDVLGDTDTLIALCADSNACDYMARSTTWASGVAADSTAMLIVGKYNYCANALLDDNTWETAIQNSPYSDYVNPDPSAGYIPLVPVMTDNTHPSGVASASSELTTGGVTYSAFKAFDQIATRNWVAGAGSNQWLQYRFPNGNKEVVKRIAFKMDINSSQTQRNPTTNFYIQGSNDGTNFTTLLTVAPSQVTGALQYFDINNDTAYEYYRIANLNSPWGCAFSTVQFYKVLTEYIVIHSAANDTIYYLDGSTPVTVAVTDANGKAVIDTEDLDPGTYTLYSTVAKNPDNLSNPYTKTVKINGNTTEIYVMPIMSLYWWGYESSNLEDCTTANGWTPASGHSFASPSHNTNDITLSSATNTMACIGTKNNIITGTIKGIAQGVGGGYGYFTVRSNKNMQGATQLQQSTHIDATTQKKYEVIYTEQSTTFFVQAYDGASSKIYALWYE